MGRESVYLMNGEKNGSYLAAMSAKPFSNGIFTIVMCDHRYIELHHKSQPSGIRLYRRYGKNGIGFYAMCPVCDVRTVEYRKAGDALAEFAAHNRYRTRVVLDKEEPSDE